MTLSLTTTPNITEVDNFSHGSVSNSVLTVSCHISRKEVCKVTQVDLWFQALHTCDISSHQTDYSVVRTYSSGQMDIQSYTVY